MIAQISNYGMLRGHWTEEMRHGQWIGVIGHFRFYVKFQQMKRLLACLAGMMVLIIVIGCPMKNSGSDFSYETILKRNLDKKV